MFFGCTRSGRGAVNCGYALVLDGSERVDEIIKIGVSFDVIGGVARRCWSRTLNARPVAQLWNQNHKDEGHITIPFLVKEGLLENLIK